ncbi:MAG TPA: hypothetical protein VGZ32_09420 [Actinocrinis sp.]|uniref:sacsin N-terminal ATP-binding-like domain-containing protein n=1 Tax=Actinocrinis sp. TaxID=1920516 RepID=UPI002DDCA858|nr:hypothetical protein [Actinocrinis sp.]HEV3170548.1 hypothetical protein [Actinocrinis sp.]
MTDDRFDTAAIRARVLDSWAAAPVRFREDANLEEDLVLGAYRDRIVIELAQNAADAATRAGRPGRLRLTLDTTGPLGVTLRVANTGAPLDAGGVVGLSTLRASTKRDEWDGPDAGPVGRFGVGFAAVLAVSDEPALLSRHGSVRFSASQARDAVAGAAEQNIELGEELRRREGRVPVLRLPFPADGLPPQGYDTVVELPLRDSAAEATVRRLLTEIDDALLLSLPQLAEIVVEVDGSVRTLTSRRGGPDEWTVVDGDHATTWRLARAHGDIDPLLLANRPVEERTRPFWSITWAVPVGADGEPRRPRTEPVVHAPTPTDEPLGLPALLIATFPLEPTRRHVAPGELQEFLLDKAADAYGELIERWPTRTPGLLRLVPGRLAEGALDAGLRERVAQRLPLIPFLPAADAAQSPLRPRDATVIVPCDEALVAAVVDVLPGLLPAGWEADPLALSALGIRRIELAELVETLAALGREPAWWGRLFAALDQVAGYDPGVREALAAVPVPLADGRTVRGAVGALLPDSALGEDRLAALRPLGLRVVHPAALFPGSGPYALLERLGARPARPRAILADPAVRAAVTASRDALAQADADGFDTPRALAEAVLTLVRAAEPGPDDRFDLGDLQLPDDNGGHTPARELLLPASPLADIVRPGSFGRVDQEWVRRWGPETLRAVGVLDSFTVVRAADVILDSGPDEQVFDLDGFEDWLDDLRDLLPLPARDAPPVAPELIAVRDLDLVAPDRWAEALDLLAGPALRAAVVSPIRVLTGDGEHLEVPSYTSWWLSRREVLGGRRPGELATGAGLLRGLYDAAAEVEGAAGLDPEFLTGLGVRSTLEALLATPGGPDELLDRLADPDREVTAVQLVELYAALAAVPSDRLAPPVEVRALEFRAPQDAEVPEEPGAPEPVVVEAGDAVVLDAPDLLPLFVDRPVIVVPHRFAATLADLLDVDLASEAVEGRVTSEGEPEEVPEVVRDLMPWVPETYVEHDELVLDDEVEVQWRVQDGVVHASTFDGLARALAWAAGRWDRRHLIAALLAEPERAGELAVEAYFD